MADIKRAQCSRRAGTHLKKILASVDEELANPQPLSEDNTATLRDLHDQLIRKHELITPLDAKILEATKDEAIEAEILQAEETNAAISRAKAKITHCLSSITARDTTTSPCAPPPPATECQADHASTVTHLPKLELPQFSGNPILWQSFWDTFEASVHNNTSLTGVQKLSYFRGQLQGEAACVIAGFQLTNANYQHSIDLLKDHFGQPHKQIEAHMQALLDIRSPSGTLTSLREFHNTIEGNICSLASLGKSQDTYQQHACHYHS